VAADVLIPARWTITKIEPKAGTCRARSSVHCDGRGYANHTQYRAAEDDLQGVRQRQPANHSLRLLAT
jgi:hypothetical protein